MLSMFSSGDTKEDTLGLIFHLLQFQNFFCGTPNEELSILDIGCGDGIYSTLIKDCFIYADGGSDEIHGNKVQMDAVEAYEPFVEQYDLKSKYNNVYADNIMNLIDKKDFKHYHVYILGDVLEHLSIEDAKRLIDYIHSSGGKAVAVVPYNYPMEQDGDNPYSAHIQSDLEPEVMEDRYPDLEPYMTNDKWGIYTTKGIVEMI